MLLSTKLREDFVVVVVVVFWGGFVVVVVVVVVVCLFVFVCWCEMETEQGSTT